MAGPGDVTLVQQAIHNPNEPRHFMRVVAAEGRHRATIDGTVVADSANAVVVKEVGRDIYDPVVYFPRADVDMTALTRTDTTTHCPLKGDTEYYDVAAGDHGLTDAAWSYVEMVLGDELKDLVAFDAGRIEVHPG